VRQWLAALFLAVATCGVFAAAGDNSPEMLGKRLYREGILPDGRPLVATLASGVQAQGRQAACATCHRKSGLGAAEGQNVIRPLTVPGFFAGQENARRYARPHFVKLRQLQYTDDSFDHALRHGESVDGRVLNPLMPRYHLDRDAISALRAYLSSIAVRPAAGVTDSEIHFATIIAADAEPHVRAATLQVLGAMVDLHNAGTRSERHRQRAGVESMHVDWRRWALHVWELTGDASTWAAQLDRFYARQPVFAVLSGAGGHWQPVHDFCEQQEVPCLFPNVDVPGRAEPGNYSLYLSKGMLVEGEVMAHHLAGRGLDGPVLQLRRSGHRAEAGARAFQQAWRARSKGPVQEAVLSPGQAMQTALAGLPATKPAAVIAWFDAADLGELARLDLPSDVPFLASGTLLGTATPGVDRRLAEQLAVVWPFTLPAGGQQRIDRVRQWLITRGLPFGDEHAQANTYLAATMAGDAIAMMTNNYSREYFIERIEHYADKSLATGAFPQIGLGPGQRFAAKGSYVVHLDSDAGLRTASDWIVP
jgi:hypothetical protein